MRKDKYDKAVAYLTAHPEEIFEAWNTAVLPKGRRRGWELFQPLGLPGACGCATQVKYSGMVAATLHLTAAIRRTKWIPWPEEIGVEHLERFGQIQRKVDEMGLRTKQP